MSENSRGETKDDISISILSALSASKKKKSTNKNILALQKQVRGLKNVVGGLLTLLKSQAEETVFFLSNDMGKNGPPSKDMIHLLSSNYQVKQKVTILLSELEASQVQEAEDEKDEDQEMEDINEKYSALQNINGKMAESEARGNFSYILPEGLDHSRETSFLVPSDKPIRSQSSPKVNRVVSPQEHQIAPQHSVSSQSLKASQSVEHSDANNPPQVLENSQHSAVHTSPVVSNPPIASQSPGSSQVDPVDAPAPAETHVQTQPKPQPVPKSHPINRNWGRSSQIQTRSQAHAKAQAKAVAEDTNSKPEADVEAVLDVSSVSESPKDNQLSKPQAKTSTQTKAQPHPSPHHIHTRSHSQGSASRPQPLPASDPTSPPSVPPLGSGRITRNSSKARALNAIGTPSQDQASGSQDIIPAPPEFVIVNSSTAQQISKSSTNEEDLTPAPPINSKQESSAQSEKEAATSNPQPSSSSTTSSTPHHDLPLPVTQSKLIKNFISFSPANAVNKPTQNDTIKKLMMRREASLFADILPPSNSTSSSSSSNSKKPKPLTISLRTTRASERKQMSKSEESTPEDTDNEAANESTNQPIKKNKDDASLKAGSKRDLETPSVEEGTDSDIAITSDAVTSSRSKRPRRSHSSSTTSDSKNVEDSSVLPDSTPLMDPDCRYYRIPSDEYTVYSQVGNQQFRNGYLRNHYGNIILFQELGQIALKKKLLIGVGNQKLSPYKNDSGNVKLNLLLHDLMLLRAHLQDRVRKSTEIANKKIEEIKKNHSNLSDSNKKIICSQEIPMLELMHINSKELKINEDLVSEGLYRVMRTRAHNIEYCVCNRVIGYCTSLCPCYKSLGGCRAPQCESLDSPNDFCPSNRRYPLYK